MPPSSASPSRTSESSAEDLNPRHIDDVLALRAHLPVEAAWFSSPEVKAKETARLLTTEPVEVVDALGEQVRSGWVEDLRSAVNQAFAHPDVPALPGWESLEACTNRVASAVTYLRAAHPHSDLVLVGHGTAWTLLAARMKGTQPDLTALRAMAFPDLIVL